MGSRFFTKTQKRGLVNNLDSPKTELRRRNPAKKSTKAQKNELRQTPSTAEQTLFDCLLFGLDFANYYIIG
jgi:hypothetical protein